MVLLGQESSEVGFLVKLNQAQWEELTQKKYPPETLIKRTFQFLLQNNSKYTLKRTFHIYEVQEQFPEYQELMRKRIFLPMKGI